MRLWPLFPALHLYPSDIEKTHARRAGMRGLRHKSRHKIAAALSRDVPTKIREAGVVHSTPAFACGGAGGLCK